MKLYHASTIVVEKPVVMNRFKTLDFGTGFYTTANEEQAHDFARKAFLRRGKSGALMINVYECDWEQAIQSLRILEFVAPDEAWLDFVVHNRRFGRDESLGLDIVTGPVANDDIFATIALFGQGFVSKLEAIERFKVKHLFNQYLFCNDKALSYLAFKSSYEVGVS